MAHSRTHISFIASSSVIFAGSFVVNVLNYVFTLVISRLIGVTAFGEVTALFSLLLVVSVPATALSMLMAREAAFRQVPEGNAVAHLFARLKSTVLIFSFAIWILFVLAIPFTAAFLQVSWGLLALFSVVIPVTLAGALQTGALQGMQEFLTLSKQNIINALIKLTVALALVYAGMSVAGVLIGLIVAQSVSWVYGYYATRALAERASPEAAGASLRPLFLSILVTTFLLALLSNLDVLLVKHFMTPEIAGQYGALSTIGKILVYGIGAFITVLLPMASAAHRHSEAQGLRLLGFSLGVIAAASVCAYLVFTFAPHLVIDLLFGGRYAEITPYLAQFSIAMACISLSTALINYFIAIHDKTFVYLLLAGIAVEAVLITLNHQSLSAVSEMLVISSGILLTLLAANLLGKRFI